MKKRIKKVLTVFKKGVFSTKNETFNTEAPEQNGSELDNVSGEKQRKAS